MKEVLLISIENTRKLLSIHDIQLGMSAWKKRIIGKNLEDDIQQMQTCIDYLNKNT